MIMTCPYQIECRRSPLDAIEAWRIERFLLNIFETGNYSFRRALTGTYDDQLACMFYLAHDGEEIIAAAGCLLSADHPYAAILSPVCVAPDYRRKGIATELCHRLFDELQQYGVSDVYLGVSQGHPARNLYRRLGFSDCSGIVMQKTLCEPTAINPPSSNLRTKDLSWGDYADVSALMCERSSMMTFDYHSGIFSSKYEPVSRFLTVFPELMGRIGRAGGCAKILKDEISGKITGIAHACFAQSVLQRHIAYLDFFANQASLTEIETLVRQVSRQVKETGDCQLQVWVSEADEVKKTVLEILGADRISVLPNTILLDQKMYNVEVFQF
jgi:ribosomal protein S18 acetylase RimI-like enzyme